MVVVVIIAAATIVKLGDVQGLLVLLAVAAAAGNRKNLQPLQSSTEGCRHSSCYVLLLWRGRCTAAGTRGWDQGAGMKWALMIICLASAWECTGAVLEAVWRIFRRWERRGQEVGSDPSYNLHSAP